MAKKPSTNAAQNVDPRLEAECLMAYRDLKAEAARVSQKTAALFDRYSKMGVDQKVVKALYSLEQKENPAAWQKKVTSSAIAVGILDQGDFSDFIGAPRLDPETARLLRNQQVRRDGYEAGQAGANTTACKYPVGSELYVIWRQGYTVGEEERRELHPEKATESAPAPRQRKGAKAAEVAAAPPPAAAAPGPAAEPAPGVVSISGRPRGRPKKTPPAPAPASPLPPLFKDDDGVDPEPPPLAAGSSYAYVVPDDEVETLG